LLWSDLFAGLAFYLIIEGLIPFANPQGWRRGLTVLFGPSGAGKTMILELGPVLTGLALSGRVGANIAAELGTDYRALGDRYSKKNQRLRA
jgi:hypothetical protein